MHYVVNLGILNKSLVSENLNLLTNFSLKNEKPVEKVRKKYEKSH